MSNLKDLAYQLDPAVWVEQALNVAPQDWQKQLLRAKRGASIIVLTARQVGKTTAAAEGRECLWTRTRQRLAGAGAAGQR